MEMMIPTIYKKCIKYRKTDGLYGPLMLYETYDRAHEIAYGFGDPSEKNVSLH